MISATGTTIASRAMARSLFSNSPPHSMRHPRRAAAPPASSLALRLGDERAQVAPAHVHPDADVAAAVLAIDARPGPRPSPTSASAPSGTVTPPSTGTRRLADLLHVVARATSGSRSTTSNAALALPELRHRHAAHRGLEDVLEVAQAHAVARQRLAVGRDLDLRHLAALHDAQVGDARAPWR